MTDRERFDDTYELMRSWRKIGEDKLWQPWMIYGYGERICGDELWLDVETKVEGKRERPKKKWKCLSGTIA